jgi:Cof subfamily protein (haloacid dehalogenase superfamily)
MTTDTTPTPTIVVVEAAVAPPTTTTLLKEHEHEHVQQQQQQYRMVALDLDGTLLNSQHQLSEATIAYIRYLDNQGFLVIIATGRAIPTVYETILTLNLPRPIPVVCSNGAEGYLCSINNTSTCSTCSVEKQSLFSTPVPEIVAKRILELSNELGFVTQYYVGEHIYANPQNEQHLQLTRLYQELTGCDTIYIPDHHDFTVAWQQGLPSKQLILCPTQDQDTMMEICHQEFSKDHFLIHGKPATIIRGNLGWFLEILHPEVCKGNGLKLMCQHLDIDPKQCLAFGDGDNDIEFLQLAGKGFAMKNARDVVKAIADEVIEYNNDEDGVIRTLKVMESQGFLAFPK